MYKVMIVLRVCTKLSAKKVALNPYGATFIEVNMSLQYIAFSVGTHGFHCTI